MTSRRSFLALLAGALAVNPELLTATTEIEIPQSSKNPIIGDWWNQWAIQDAVTVAPNLAVDEVLFSTPIPANFALRGIQWGMEPSILLRDMQALLESLSIALECDGLEYFRGPIQYLPISHGYPIFPQIVPRKSANLIVSGDPADITLPATVHFQLSGICAMPEVRR